VSTRVSVVCAASAGAGLGRRVLAEQGADAAGSTLGRGHPLHGRVRGRAPADVSEVRDLVLFLHGCRAENALADRPFDIVIGGMSPAGTVGRDLVGPLNRIGASNVSCPPHMVPHQLKNLIPVGIAIMYDMKAKKGSVSDLVIW